MEDINDGRAQFHAISESTQEDWQLIGGELERFAKKLPERLIAHLNLLHGDYGGFPVDRRSGLGRGPHRPPCATIDDSMRT